MLATEVRSGDAPKPSFSMKPYEKSKTSGNQHQINHKNVSLFLNLEQGEAGRVAHLAESTSIAAYACRLLRC